MKKLLVFCLLLSGCVQGSAMLVGDVRPATKPEAVRLYIDPPQAYERIALVTAEAEDMGSQQVTQDLALQELKEQAAKVGANGVLLRDMGDKSVNYASWGGGSFFFGTANNKVLRGEAIYVK